MGSIKAVLSAALLIYGGSVSATIYKTIDGDGNVVFTDAPPADASPVELSPASTYEPPPIHTSPPPTGNETASAPEAYGSMNIVEPQAEATIRENSGRVDVRVEIEPALINEAGHRIQFYLDGQPIGEPSSQLQTSLSNVDRGEHQLEAAVLDFTGKELTRSTSVRFYLQRVSTAQQPASKPIPTPFRGTR